MKNNPTIESHKRIYMAYLLATNPELFNAIVQNNAILFHGTNSNALPSILKNGMNSVDKSLEEHIPVLTGEEWSRINGHRSFISFTDDISIALGYSLNGPINTKAEDLSSFGVLLGMSTNDLDKVKTIVVHSDLPEVGIVNHLPLEYIKFIAVPEPQTSFVKKLVGDKPISVFPIDMNDKFYSCSNRIEMVNYLTNLIEMPQVKETADSQTPFTEKSLQKVAQHGILSKIKNMYNMIAGAIRKREAKDGEKSRH